MTTSVKADYALAALLDLAMHPGQGPIKIADVAKRQQIPQKFLELILASLKQGGFVDSKRGAEGGYLLSRPASGIVVGDVLRHVEGRRAPRRRAKESPFAGLWKRVDEAVSAVVDQTTLEDVARDWQLRQANYVPNWEI